MRMILILTCIMFSTVSVFAQDTNAVETKEIRDTLIFKQDASGNIIIFLQSTNDKQTPELNSIKRNQVAFEFHDQYSKAIINQTGADNRVVISITDSSRKNSMYVKQKGKQNQASIYINGKKNTSVINQSGNCNSKKKGIKTNKKSR